MKHLQISVLLLLLSCCYSKTRAQNAMAATTDVLVFFDMTSSVDSSSFTLALKKLVSFYSTIPCGSKFNIIPIGDKLRYEIIYAGTIPLKQNSVKKNQLIRISQKKEIEKIIFTLKRKRAQLLSTEGKDKLAKGQESKRHSCIIESLNRANSYFQNKQGLKYLVYISDMIENCDCDAMRINMFGNPQKQVLAKIDREYNPGFNLKMLLKGNIYMVITSDYVDISHQSPYTLSWKHIFNRIGYSDHDFDMFYKSLDVPENIFPANGWFQDLKEN